MQSAEQILSFNVLVQLIFINSAIVCRRKKKIDSRASSVTANIVCTMTEKIMSADCMAVESTLVDGEDWWQQFIVTTKDHKTEKETFFHARNRIDIFVFPFIFLQHLLYSCCWFCIRC